VPNSNAAGCTVQADAREVWELQQLLPTGTRRAAEGMLDLTTLRSFETLRLDDVYTGVESAPAVGELRLLGSLRQAAYAVEMRLLAAPAFRELVMFTPGHRQAICLEPYTCATDAINLQQRGIEAGWRVLQPGETWSADVVCEVAFPATRSS